MKLQKFSAYVRLYTLNSIYLPLRKVANSLESIATLLPVQNETNFLAFEKRRFKQYKAMLYTLKMPL